MRRVLSIACGILAVSLAGVCPAQTTTSAPASPQRPPVDHVKDLFDLYSQGDERTRFFDATGVDGELSGKEFAAAGGKPKSFVRAYDRWEATVPFDGNGSGKLSWAEAEKYRESIRKHVLAMFDKNKDGKLTGEERAVANLYLRGGMKMPVIVRGPEPAPAGKGQEGQPAAPELRRQAQSGALQAYDSDGDGQISAEERQAMFQQMRGRWELQRYDKNKDGALDDEEKAARDTERENLRRRAEAMRTRMGQQRTDLMRRWDTDGNGQLSDQERAAMRDEVRRRAQQRQKEMDADGDGKVSGEESRNYWRKLRQKYDADKDGRLNQQERQKMIEEEGTGQGGRRPGRRQGQRGARRQGAGDE